MKAGIVTKRRDGKQEANAAALDIENAGEKLSYPNFRLSSLSRRIKLNLCKVDYLKQIRTRIGTEGSHLGYLP